MAKPNKVDELKKIKAKDEGQGKTSLVISGNRAEKTKEKTAPLQGIDIDNMTLEQLRSLLKAVCIRMGLSDQDGVVL